MSALVPWGWVAVAQAGGPQLLLQADTQHLQVGQSADVQLQVVNARSPHIPTLAAPAGLDVQFAGQGTQDVMVNFQHTRIVAYTYTVTALREGRWLLGPVDLDVGGQTLHANALAFDVEARGAGEGASAKLSHPNPFVGEVVVYTFQVASKESILDAAWNEPEFDGFSKEPNAGIEQRPYQVTQDGVPLDVREISLPLITTLAGAHRISPAGLKAQVAQSQRGRASRVEMLMGMAPSRTELFSSPAIDVAIRPLPAKPPGFSGLVGTFKLTSSESATEVALGDTVTVTTRLEGTGTLAGFRLPELPAGPYKVYDDTPDTRATVEKGAYKSSGVYKRAIVPTSTGTLVLPGYELVVFDPIEEAYVTLRTPERTLTVTPGENTGNGVQSFATDPAGPTTIESLGDDLLPTPGEVAIRDRSLGAALPIALGMPLVPVAALVALQLRAVRDRRQVEPRRVLAQRLAALPADPAQRLSSLEGILRDAAGLRLEREAPGLERADIDGLGPAWAAVQADVERARYAGATADLVQVEAALRTLVEAL